MSTSDNLLRHQPLSRGIRLNFRHSAKPRTAISSPHHRTRFRCHKKDILTNLIQVYPPTHDIRLLPYAFISPRTKSSPDKVVHRTRKETHKFNLKRKLTSCKAQNSPPLQTHHLFRRFQRNDTLNFHLFQTLITRGQSANS